MAEYVVPREIFFGRDSIEKLSYLRGKRAVLITAGEKMEQRGFSARALDALKRTGMEAESIKAHIQNDAELCAQEGAAALRAFMPDWIVALGSECIAAAKLMWVFYEYPEATLLDLQVPGSIPRLRRKSRFATIPGPDSAVDSASAYLQISGTKNRAAWSLHDSALVPDAVFLTPEMLEAESAEQIADAAAAVFARAADVLLGRQQMPFSMPCAVQAAKTVLACSRGAAGGGGEERNQLLHAATLAEMAFSNAGFAPSAALARQTAGFFPCAARRRGAAALLFLPHLIRFYAEDAFAATRCGQFAAMLGIRGRTPFQAALNLAKRAEELGEMLQLPGTLHALGADSLFFEQYLDTLSARAAADPYAADGFRALTESGTKALLAAAYGG